MKPSEFPTRKGQAFVSDFVIATVVFMIVLALIVYMWDEMLSGIDALKDIEDMEWSASNAVEQLMGSEGVPKDWYLEPDKVIVIGLVDSGFFGEKKDRVLDPDKVIQLINLTENNYSIVRNKLLRTGEYDFYMTISCLNSSNRSCFDGLVVDGFSSGNVSCLNGFNIGVHNDYTDSYLWREAESYDSESGTDDISEPDLSEDAGRKLQAKDDWLSYDVDIPVPNIYWIWSRYYSTGGGPASIDLSIGGTKSSESFVQEISPEWKKSTASFTLGKGGNTLLINRTASAGSPIIIDAIILTSNPDYVPQNTEESHYGNFHLVGPTTCIMGNYTEQANSTSIISTTRTATFHNKLNSIISLNLVMWSGTATEIPVTTTVTTTIIPTGALLCDIFTSNDGEVSSYCPGGVGEYTCIFSLWQPSNSHAGSCSYGSRDLCCRVLGEDLTATIRDGCSAGEGGVISMHDTSNSHVEEYNTGSYDSDVCLGIGGGGEMQCGIYSGSCPAEGNYGEVGSIYSTSDSHAAQFSYYDYKICCNVTVIPTTTTSTSSTTSTLLTTTTSTTTTTTVPVLSCSIKASCLGTEACMFTMYDTYNDDTTGAHGANCTGGGIYDNLVCCSASGCAPTCEVVSSPGSCSLGYEPVLSLYNGTDAHAQDPDTYSTYTNVICCTSGACGGTLSCGVTSSCSDTCLASMASDDDSHLGDCNAYTDKICCTINP